MFLFIFSVLILIIFEARMLFYLTKNKRKKEGNWGEANHLYFGGESEI